MNLSVVIATKDRAPFLARALDSLAVQQSAPPFEAIIVDNGSHDTTPALLAERAAVAPFPLRTVHVARPNRGAARNAGIAAARGALVAFVDDDVWLPPGFLAAHAAAHRGPFAAAVSGPILNVGGYDARPAPRAANYSRAFFCTCNVSVPRSALMAAGGFDESFDLYGWEDTELGLRLRRRDVRRIFAWDAYLWHIKPPESETLEIVHAKTVERARMAARLLGKDRSLRTKLATGAYGLNVLRSTVFAPPWSLGMYRAAALNERAPKLVRMLARMQYLDGAYTATLRRTRRNPAG
ncbi:MAG: glycosyltransferase family 2 protein [Candidatus Eremiobacteraeota bacterium]|nr:glycosyltransferase family 2 protein [Candidatus Eremiobacteraeota bacterium]